MKKCFLCGRNGYSDRLERHHIFEGPLRKKSEEYNLVVWLCGERCHRNGEHSAHKCKETAALLHRYGQKKAMRENGWDMETWRSLFGRNYK